MYRQVKITSTQRRPKIKIKKGGEEEKDIANQTRKQNDRSPYLPKITLYRNEKYTPIKIHRMCE